MVHSAYCRKEILRIKEYCFIAFVIYMVIVRLDAEYSSRPLTPTPL